MRSQLPLLALGRLHGLLELPPRMQPRDVVVEVPRLGHHDVLGRHDVKVVFLRQRLEDVVVRLVLFEASDRERVRAHLLVPQRRDAEFWPHRLGHGAPPLDGGAARRRLRLLVLLDKGHRDQVVVKGGQPTHHVVRLEHGGELAVPRWQLRPRLAPWLHVVLYHGHLDGIGPPDEQRAVVLPRQATAVQIGPRRSFWTVNVRNALLR
mmetsp:Transcript_23640/g.61783  ORF Transcript_23640/g.61783 Transcript_23640/m.61783 type:complete len:207 (-) Transcript_23640:683-1303(-)